MVILEYAGVGLVISLAITVGLIFILRFYKRYFIKNTNTRNIDKIINKIDNISGICILIFCSIALVSIILMIIIGLLKGNI